MTQSNNGEKTAPTLDLEGVARYPKPGMVAPQRIAFTPDGCAVTYLFSADGTLVQQLWQYDLATGQKSVVVGGAPPQPLSRDEELRRERLHVREFGVTGYHYAPKSAVPTLCVPMAGRVYIKRGDGALTEIVAAAGAQDPRLSPDATRLAFVRDDELWVVGIDGGDARQLTTGAGDGITNGLAEYIAQEEMDRQEGYWWSADSRRIAYVRADSRNIPLYPIVHQGKAEVETEAPRYPFAGQPNAIVQLGVITIDDARSGETLWMDIGAETDIYLARVAWLPGGALVAQIESRDQTHLRLIAFDPTTGAATPIISETQQPWLNLTDDVRFLASGDILWSSERTGFRHLYLYDSTGNLLRPLTGGDWVVTAVLSVDEARRDIYFQATRESVLERHIYRVSLDGGDPQRLTHDAGWHDAAFAPDFSRFVDTWSSVEHPPKVALRTIDGTLENLLHQSDVSPAPLGLRPPELTSFQSCDGVTLYAAVYTPDAPADGTRLPIIVSVYGGPHAQKVANAWDVTVDLRPHYLAQHGFVVLKVDNRGSANRGLAFEAALARDMGNVEVHDQEDGVRWLAQRPYTDGSRVGVYGWSYGGYMACMCVMRAPQTFKVAVAGAPVTHWDGYDTHYTERYMATPQTNATGYEESAVLAHVDGLAGKLMLIHGMVDENVHFRHTARLLSALNAAQKPYDLLIFPEERHMPRDAKGLTYMERRLVEYFQQNL